MKYTKYKKNIRVACFGPDDVWKSNTDSQYKTIGSTFTNGKICRCNLNGALNDVILSNNARLILESGYFQQ